MRQINHRLVRSKSGKSVTLRMEVNDMYGRKNVNFSVLRGWRMLMAEKHLGSVESDDWNSDVARKYVAMKVLGCAKDEFEGTKFLGVVKEHGIMEVHFWASKFMLEERTAKAWRALYSRD